MWYKSAHEGVTGLHWTPLEVLLLRVLSSVDYSSVGWVGPDFCVTISTMPWQGTTLDFDGVWWATKATPWSSWSWWFLCKPMPIHLPKPHPIPYMSKVHVKLFLVQACIDHRLDFRWWFDTLDFPLLVRNFDMLSIYGFSFCLVFTGPKWPSRVLFLIP